MRTGAKANRPARWLFIVDDEDLVHFDFAREVLAQGERPGSLREYLSTKQERH
jgi:hypothetical protein